MIRENYRLGFQIDGHQFFTDVHQETATRKAFKTFQHTKGLEGLIVQEWNRKLRRWETISSLVLKQKEEWENLKKTIKENS